MTDRRKNYIAAGLWTITIIGIATSIYLQGKIDARTKVIEQIAAAAGCVKQNGEWECQKYLSGR